MVQYEAMNKGLGVAEMISLLISKTWKAPRSTGIEGLIQIQTEEVLLTYLLLLASMITILCCKSVLQTIEDLKAFIDTKLNNF
jgi:hypothetical protein